MKGFARLLREPLLHFFICGGLIFVLYVAVSGSSPESVDTIVIEPARIEQLAAGFQGVWQRPATDDELRALIDDFIREEIYYREALALGLDRDDTMIRRRLRQKMEFLTDTGADFLEPSAGELETYLAANEQAFRQPPQLAFEQIFLGEHPPPERIEASLSALQTELASDPSAWSERTLLPAQLSLAPPGAIDGVFGQGFFEQLGQMPSGGWAGPVKSAYGQHLVRIIDRLPGRLPALDDVRDAVLRDWRAARALELRERYYARLRERYAVEIRDAAAPTVEDQ